MAEGERYFFADADTAAEHARLRLIEEAYDPRTRALLSALGVEAGWRCLEVGAGAGSVAVWLARRVGPSGQVLALDRDTRHLEWIGEPNVTVRRVDVVEDELPRGEFDLVHFRGLLEHLHDVERAMAQMADALRSGGWLLGEGGDFARYRAVETDHPLASLFDRAMAKTFSFIKEADVFDPFIVGSLPMLFERAGLVDVSVSDDPVAIRGSEPKAVMFETSWQAFDPVLTANGVLTDEEASARHDAHSDPSFSFTEGAVGAWGHLP